MTPEFLKSIIAFLASVSPFKVHKDHKRLSSLVTIACMIAIVAYITSHAAKVNAETDLTQEQKEKKNRDLDLKYRNEIRSDAEQELQRLHQKSLGELVQLHGSNKVEEMVKEKMEQIKSEIISLREGYQESKPKKREEMIEKSASGCYIL